MVPAIMFIGQEKRMSPFFSVFTFTVTGLFSGSSAFTPWSLMTIAVAQVPSTLRVTESSTGSPCFTLICEGSNPLSVTSTLMTFAFGAGALWAALSAANAPMPNSAATTTTAIFFIGFILACCARHRALRRPTARGVPAALSGRAAAPSRNPAGHAVTGQLTGTGHRAAFARTPQALAWALLWAGPMRHPGARIRILVRTAAALASVTYAAGVHAAEAAPSPFANDALLARLIEESLAARPELKQAEALVRAERERIPQAGALPDPVLSLGIQNDGFSEIMIGKMETSYYQVMLSQGIPWPGKLGLRTDVAQLAASQAEARLRRARLSAEADVRRTYLGLILVRERLALLDRLESIWQTSSGVARSRYEAGEGVQSDVLRSQLEVNRIRARRWALQAEERNALQALNRLRAHPVDDPIATTAKLGGVATPEVQPLEAALADARDRSPELALARLGVDRAETQTRLARQELFPDLSATAGVMPRGGLGPMWQAGLSLSLPVWAYRKQTKAIAESEARAGAEAQGARAIDQILRLRVAERRAALQALVDTVRLYRQGLLVESQATAESTLAQYRVGKVTFASVLEANAGFIGDEEGFLLALAEALRIEFAAAEVTLDPVGIGGIGGGMGGASVPGAGAAASGMGAGPAAAGAPAAGSSSAAQSMSSM